MDSPKRVVVDLVPDGVGTIVTNSAIGNVETEVFVEVEVFRDAFHNAFCLERHDDQGAYQLIPLKRGKEFGEWYPDLDAAVSCTIENNEKE